MSQRNHIVPSDQPLPVFVPEFPSDLYPDCVEDWGRIWKRGRGGYTEFDIPIIRRLCELYHDYRATRKLLDTLGYVEDGSQGQSVAGACTKVLSQIMKDIRADEDRLGLNPRSAGQLGLNLLKGQQISSDLEAFLDE